MKQYLILGCGNSLDKRLRLSPGSPEKEFDGEVTTVDYTTEVNPDILTNLSDLPYDWADDESFDEIHAYGILEHCGTQGDADFFFGQFNELHRILRPDGLILITVPRWDTACAFGVPDHRRVMPACLFAFLEEKYYDNLGKPGFGDYRHFLKGYWEVVCGAESGELLNIVLRKV